jgi:hypothetical protein
MRVLLSLLFLLRFAYPCLASTVAIATTTLPSGAVDVPFSATVNASGGCTPYEWTISGDLPSGITETPSSDRESLGLTGTPTAAGTYSFTVSVTGCGGHVFERVYTVVIEQPSVGDTAACAPPTYNCARKDTSVVPLPSPLPNWGGLYGAGSIFYEPTFNSGAPPQYVRVTDGRSADVAVSAGQTGARYSGFSVGSGSGDDAHFNADDSLFTITDNQDDYYVYGLNPSNMQTGLVWFTYEWGNLIWSQINRNYAYAMQQSPGLWRLDFTNCSLGGPTCSPQAKELYDFTNCGFPPGWWFFANSGIGGSDTVFAGATGVQDTDNRIYAYNASTNTCYFYNTRFGIIRSATGTQSPTTGTATCDGTSSLTWASGSSFATGLNTWAGANISLGSAGVFQVASVQSSTSLTLGYTCPSGTYSYSIYPGTYVGTITPSTDLYSVHDARIDPSGTWLIVEQGQECYSSSCNVIHAWKIGTTTVNDCIWQAWGTDSGSCASHYTETASGWINADDAFYPTLNPTMQYRTWANVSTTTSSDVRSLNSVPANVFSTFDDHPTAKNDPLGTHAYPVFSSTYAPESYLQITEPFSNEVIAWSQSGGPVLRFGHTFNTSLSPFFTATYAIGAVSSTGKYYIYTTDGEGTLGSGTGETTCSITETCRSDVFILRLSPPAN